MVSPSGRRRRSEQPVFRNDANIVSLLESPWASPSRKPPKRCRPSPPGAVTVAAAAATVPDTAAAGPSAPAPAAAPVVAPGGSDMDRVKSQFICPICQELIVAAHAAVPCGHAFCGLCLSDWLQNKRDCPMCRGRCTAAPVRQVMVDNAIEVMQLSEEEKEDRQVKQSEWEMRRQDAEAKMKRPWEATGGRAAGLGMRFPGRLDVYGGSIDTGKLLFLSFFLPFLPCPEQMKTKS
jgi:hypothetical protein